MSAASWAVRAVTAEDVPSIIALFAEIAREGRWIATEWPFDVPAYERRYRNALVGGSLRGWVATTGDALIGHLSVHDLDADEPQLGMYVAASHRGCGIGRALIEAVSDWARERGTRSLGLRVYPDNDSARALYRATGFVEVGLERQAIPRRDGSRRDVIRMRKPLAE